MSLALRLLGRLNALTSRWFDGLDLQHPVIPWPQRGEPSHPFEIPCSSAEATCGIPTSHWILFQGLARALT